MMFFIGFIFGSLGGVLVMCLMQVAGQNSRDEEEEADRHWEEIEKILNRKDDE